jgi:hypothetical protein
MFQHLSNMSKDIKVELFETPQEQVMVLREASERRGCLVSLVGA